MPISRCFFTVADVAPMIRLMRWIFRATPTAIRLSLVLSGYFDIAEVAPRSAGVDRASGSQALGRASHVGKPAPAVNANRPARSARAVKSQELRFVAIAPL